MNIYVYFILGIILGLALTTYIYLYREEKIEAAIESNKRIYSTKKLDKALENAVTRISNSIAENKRELTEEEKDNIIFECIKRVESLNSYVENDKKI